METISYPLDGKKIGIVVEHKFIPEEIAAYQTGFSLLGAQVEFISRIYYGDSRPDQSIFNSDVDPLDQKPWATPQECYVRKDISKVNLEEYAALLMCANYPSVRLRYGGLPDPLPPNFNLRAHLQTGLLELHKA